MLRILSLLPAATEIVYLLGLEKYLVGVSHECDYPPQAKKKPQVTSSAVSNQMSSFEIDKVVGNLTHQGPGVFHIKKNQLKKLKPNLIITQELCKVCAIPFTQVEKAVRILEGEVKIISLEPESVEDILENIRVVGEFGGKEKEARKQILSLRSRMTKVSSRLASARSNNKLRVLVIEWLDPVMVAGHWVPEMVELAGGVNLITKIGEKSRKINLAQKLLNPDILIISPCGFDIQGSLEEQDLISNVESQISNVSNAKVYLVDGNSYMTRPGPRIVDGVEILAEILHSAMMHTEIFPRKHSTKDWQQY